MANRASADSKASDQIERSQHTEDGSKAMPAGGGVSGGGGGTISSAKTRDQGVNASNSARTEARDSGDANDGVGVRNTTNSSTRDGNAGSLSDESGAHWREMRGVAHVEPAASVSFSLHTAGSEKQHAVTTGSLQVESPSDIFEAERRLKAFDYSTQWGPTPSSSLTRSERLARGRRLLTPIPTGWEWVDDIIRQFPALGNLKATEQYKLPNQTIEPTSESEVPLTRAGTRRRASRDCHLVRVK